MLQQRIEIYDCSFVCLSISQFQVDRQVRIFELELKRFWLSINGCTSFCLEINFRLLQLPVVLLVIALCHVNYSMILHIFRFVSFQVKLHSIFSYIMEDLLSKSPSMNIISIISDYLSMIPQINISMDVPLGRSRAVAARVFFKRVISDSHF